MSKFYVALFIWVIALPIAAQNVTISGYINDASSGESLIGANVYVEELQKGTVSNEYGFYSISIPPDEYNLVISYLGFDAQRVTIDLKDNIKMNFPLESSSTQLEEVVIASEAENSNVSETQMSVNKLDIQTIKKIPTVLGEVEILRSIQLLPGVTSVGEGASGFNVRGGSIDQNLVLLDEAPVFNSSHLFGFFSVFNPDAVKDVQLYKGGIPARYGGRLSSILDVRMKEGNNQRFEMNGGIGLIFSRLSLEAPIVKDKASFIVAGRRSYIDVLAQPFLNEDTEGSILNFYDLTAKVNYDIDDRNKLFLSGYFGRDNFGFGEQFGFNWGNTTGTLRWNHLFNDRLFSNFTLVLSDYDYQINFGEDEQDRFDWDAEIRNYSFEPELAYYLTPDNLLRFGGQSIYYRIEPGNAIGVSDNEISDFSLQPKYAWENAVFIENEQTFNNKITLNYGLRFSHFSYLGEGTAYTYGEAPVGQKRPVIDSRTYDSFETIASYSNFEPRFSIKYQLNDAQSIKASYNRTAQYLHLISNTTASTPVDVWTPSTNNIQPAIADQVALGYFQNFNNNQYEFSAELYYKEMQHLVDYIDNADLVLNEFLEGELLEGEGRAYGLELLMKKSTGRWNGWLSYTLARSERLINGINNDDWYPNRFDQTHNLSATMFYDISKRLSLSANFIYNTGTPVSFHTSRAYIQDYIIPHDPVQGRNNVRLPSYHRLDLSATLQGKKNDNRRWQSEWVFAIYNVYSRRNAFSIYNQVGEGGRTFAERIAVFGNFIPSVSYNFKF